MSENESTMKQIKTLLLVVGCASAFLATGCNSSNSTGNPVDNNLLIGGNPAGPKIPSNPGTAGKSAVCFMKACAPVVAKTQIVDPRGEFKYPDPSRFSNASQRNFYRQPIAFLDLTTINPSTLLSPSFTIGDFASASKGRYAIIAPEMIKRIQNMRDRLGAGLRVSSGYRSPAYNRKIDKSATWSRHTYGDGVDLVGKPMRSIRDACTANNSTFFLLYNDGHVHCDWRAVPLDPAFYPPTKVKTPSEQLVQNAIALSKSTEILFNESADGIRLSVKMPDIELEGEPTHEWVILSPSGQETVYDSATALIGSGSEKGTYYVKVVVGEFIESESSIEVQ